MKRNLGARERLWRLTLGASLMVVGFLRLVRGLWAVAALALGLWLTAEGLLRYCALYDLLGLSTACDEPELEE